MKTHNYHLVFFRTFLTPTVTNKITECPNVVTHASGIQRMHEGEKKRLHLKRMPTVDVFVDSQAESVNVTELEVLSLCTESTALRFIEIKCLSLRQ